MTATFHSKNPALQDSILVFNQDCELVSQLPIFSIIIPCHQPVLPLQRPVLLPGMIRHIEAVSAKDVIKPCNKLFPLDEKNSLNAYLLKDV